MTIEERVAALEEIVELMYNHLEKTLPKAKKPQVTKDTINADDKNRLCELYYGRK